MKILLIALAFMMNINASYLAKDVQIDGLTQISNKIALETLNIAKGDEYTNKQINRALKKFYNFKYFTNIKIYDNNGILHLVFQEKPFIINLEMTGYKSRDDDLKFLFESMRIKKGNMYSIEKINNAKKILLEQLKEEGFINSVVEVDIENINEQSVALVFNVNKGDEIVINKVNYIGVKKLNISKIEEKTANKEEDLVSWWFGQNDGIIQFSQMQYDSRRIKDVYLSNGYLDAKISAAYSKIDFNTNKAELDFNIDEGAQYKVNEVILYLNEELISSKKLIDEFLLEKGKIFDISKLRKDVDFVKTSIANLGYAFVNVNYDVRKNKEEKTADLIFNVNEGAKVYINDVIIKNNIRTLDRVIRRDIYLAPKDLYNLTDLRDSKSKLKRTGFFESVSITEKRISETQMNLLVDVKEAPTGNLIVGGGYGSYDGFMLNASIKDKNIFGSGLDLSLSLEHSNKTDTATIGLKNPSINDSIYNGSFEVYKKTSLISNSDNNSSDGDQTKNAEGLELGIGRSLNRHTRIGVSYTLDRSDISYEKSSINNIDYITSAITPYISYNTTDSFYVPRSGVKIGSSLKYAGVGGDAKYLQSSSYFKYFLGLEKYLDYDVIFRYKTSIKVLKDLGDIRDKTFYLGGPSSLRGYESYAFQPDDINENPYKKTISNTVELSFPLIASAKMRWALFYDYASIGEESFSDIKKAGYGASINWYSPVGPLQFIFSRAHKPTAEDEGKTSSFEFSLGTTF